VVPWMMMLGDKIPIAAVWVSEVEKMILKHCNDHVQPSTFCIKPKQYTFTAKLLWKPKTHDITQA
jgi:hypothetical protein